jgi:hypothetical protein
VLSIERKKERKKEGKKEGMIIGGYTRIYNL